jgi:hypothetical protein
VACLPHADERSRSPEMDTNQEQPSMHHL